MLWMCKTHVEFWVCMQPRRTPVLRNVLLRLWSQVLTLPWENGKTIWTSCGNCCYCSNRRRTWCTSFSAKTLNVLLHWHCRFFLIVFLILNKFHTNINVRQVVLKHKLYFSYNSFSLQEKTIQWNGEQECMSFTWPHKNKQPQSIYSFCPPASIMHVFGLWVKTRDPTETVLKLYRFSFFFHLSVLKVEYTILSANVEASTF